MPDAQQKVIKCWLKVMGLEALKCRRRVVRKIMKSQIPLLFVVLLSKFTHYLSNQDCTDLPDINISRDYLSSPVRKGQKTL